MLSHFSSRTEWVPGGNAREIKAMRNGTGHPATYADGSRYVSSLVGTPLFTNVYETSLSYTWFDNIRCSIKIPIKVTFILLRFFSYSLLLQCTLYLICNIHKN